MHIIWVHKRWPHGKWLPFAQRNRLNYFLKLVLKQWNFHSNLCKSLAYGEGATRNGTGNLRSILWAHTDAQDKQWKESTDPHLPHLWQRLRAKIWLISHLRTHRIGKEINQLRLEGIAWREEFTRSSSVLWHKKFSWENCVLTRSSETFVRLCLIHRCIEIHPNLIELTRVNNSDYMNLPLYSVPLNSMALNFRS